MQELVSYLHLINNVVLQPDFNSAVIIFLFSFVNELVGVFPYALVLAGQLIFLNDSLTLGLLAKILVFVSVPVGLGSTFGTFLIYGISYYGGKPAVRKLQRYVKFSWNDIENVSARFKGVWYDEIIFFILRCIPVIPSFPLTIVAGFFRMRFVPYFVLTAVGLTIRMMLTLIIIGVGIGGLSELLLLLYNN